MITILLALIIMCTGFYLRLRYERKYVSPILSENKNLATLRKLTIFLISMAIFSFILKLVKMVIFIMILLVPIGLYLNLKVYRLANTKYLDEKQKKKNE